MGFKRTILFTILVVAAAELVGNATAATYVVGDSLGWTVPSGGAATYVTYASQNVFTVGDVLVFNFITGAHDAAKVTKAAFDGCGSSNPISLATVGPANFTLGSPGEDYYICTFGQHCSLGQKLAINVTASTTSPAPAPAPPSPIVSPSPAPTPTPTPTPSPTPGGIVTPPSPAPAPGSVISPPSPAPGAPGTSPPPSTPPTGDLSPPPSPPPPPPPSSAPITTIIGAPSVIFVSIVIGLMI